MLATLGENVRLARLRRKLTANQVAERAGISRNTLYELEHGNGSSSVATLFLVLAVLGLENDILKIASDDVLGRKLGDLRLVRKKTRVAKPRTSDES